MNILASMAAAKMGTDLLPPWATWLWLIALTAVLVFHCGHLVRMSGQPRWFHASHILMLVSMLIMYAGMEYKWTWFPKSAWVPIFWVSTLAIAGWIAVRLIQRRPFSFQWFLALIMQASMIYMWMPNWAPALTWTLVVYFSLETVAWLSGRLDDSKAATATVAGTAPVVTPVAPTAGTARSGTALLDDSKLTTAALPSTRPRFVPLGDDSAVARASMAIMAASMAYMFAAMQLMV
jgi:hypothetical protein